MYIVEKYNILIVDDDKEFLKTISEFIRLKAKERYNVFSAYDGKEALEVFSKNKVGILILDLKMPVMDGVQLLIELHNRKIWVPVILCTGKELQTFDVYRGILYFLQKPFSFETLFNNIEEIIRMGHPVEKMASLNIPAIIQVITVDKRTGALFIKCDGRLGKIIFKDGEIINIDLDSILCKELSDEKLEFIKDLGKEIKINSRKRERVITCSEILIKLSKGQYKEEVKMAIKKEILKPLLDIDGVDGAGVYISTGEIVVSDVKPGVLLNPEAFAAFAIELFKFSSKVMGELNLGTTNFFRVETDQKIFIHKCIEVGQSAIGVVADNKANVGLIVFTLKKVIEKTKNEFPF